MTFNRNKLNNYPNTCGVYIMKDINQNILYIGKAKNLKKRLKQYFFLKDTRKSVSFLINQVEFIETITVNNNKEALILENNLIKKHQPKYNILLKDDKTYISIMINTSHPWPMIKLIRQKSKPKDKNLYFGPYTNAKAAKEIKELLLKIFPLRQCSDSEFKNRSRPCILYDIKKCLAPCIGKCTHAKYSEMVQKIISFLKGHDTSILKDLEKKMKIASERLQYEKAQECLNQINQIKHLMQNQFVDIFSMKNTDVIGLYKHNYNIIITKLIFQNGSLTSSEHFSFFEIASSNEETIASFLLQHYKKNLLPKEVIIPIKPDKNLKDFLKNQNIKITHPIKGKKKQLISLANQNAQNLFQQQKSLKSLKEKHLTELQKAFNLTNFPSHIICFDVSNISYTNNVGAMVTFIDGKKDKSKTKLFKIKTQKPGDVPALKEVLLRHFSKIKTLPSLLVVDGAKAQLNAALEILHQVNIASVDILAISKELAKHTKTLTNEKIYLPYQKPILLNLTSPILFLIQQIRDEAHRTAISFHKKRRQKSLIKTDILNIPKIGPKKAKALLTYFKSLKNLQKATREDLQKIKCLNSKDIDNILDFFLKV